MRLAKTGLALTTAALAALALTACSNGSDTPAPAGSAPESAMMSPEPSDAMMKASPDAMMSDEPSDAMMSPEPSDAMMKESPDAMMSDDSAS